MLTFPFGNAAHIAEVKSVVQENESVGLKPITHFTGPVQAALARPAISTLDRDHVADKLSPTMTLREFENGYWYLDQLRDFACQIGIPGATRLRKDEIERAIVTFLRTGSVKLPTKRTLRKTGMRDLDRGLTLNLRIEHYTGNRKTKDFIIQQARKADAEVRERSGVWYRLNRWREEQITNGNHPTYGDLVQRYIALNKVDRFDKVPHGRYINFIAEFLAAENGGTRAEAVAAWADLKAMDIPKNYASWVKARAKRRKGRR